MAKESLIKQLNPKSQQNPTINHPKTQHSSGIEPVQVAAKAGSNHAIGNKTMEKNRGLSALQKSAIYRLITCMNAQETVKSARVSRETARPTTQIFFRLWRALRP